MKNIVTAYSTKKNIHEAIKEIKNQFSYVSPKFIIYFASSIFEQQELAAEFQNTFPKAQTMGCSTAGELVNDKMLKESIVAMAMTEHAIADAKIEIVQELAAGADVKSAFASFEKHFHTPMSELDYEKYVGIILVDGLSCSEEKIMDKIGDLTNVVFIGGSAGDDLKFAKTFVSANGKTYSNAAALALIKPVKGFSIIKTQSFQPLDVQLTATKVNEANREVIEFNGKPAAEAYAEAVRKPIEKAAESFMRRPVGLMIDNEPYVRSPQQIKNNSVIFYCNILEGMELSLLRSTDIVQDTKNAVESKKQELGEITGILNFHCILRTLELEQLNKTSEYAAIFKKIPTAGFSTYGEQYFGHINQTSTMLVFK